ncbi:glycosyltransferase [Pedobacter sp. WC2501]|uniref:glycosyltransferase n=1 Tax=Pedobacter sp. WC2501 TaxID=3461400 RepID=UPI0040456DF7
MVKVSIIIPVYNAKKTLDRCLKSVLAQNYHNFEVILVNDGSKDGSKDICDHFSMSDRRFHSIHISNGGVSNARNVGLTSSIAEYVTFVDADDEITSNYLDLLLKKDDVDFALCGYRSIYMDGQDVLETIHLDAGNQFKATVNEVINHRLIRTAWGKLFKRSLIVENGLKFDTSIKLAEDTLFVLEFITNVNSIYISEEIGYLYYRPPVTVNRHNSSPEELLDIYNKFLKIESVLIKLHFSITDLKLANLQTIYFYYFNLIYSSGRFSTSERKNYFRRMVDVEGHNQLFFLNNRINSILVKPLMKFNNFFAIDYFLRLYFYLLRIKTGAN